MISNHIFYGKETHQPLRWNKRKDRKVIGLINVMQYMTNPPCTPSTKDMAVAVGGGRSVSPSQASSLLLSTEMLTNQF